MITALRQEIPLILFTTSIKPLLAIIICINYIYGNYQTHKASSYNVDN